MKYRIDKEKRPVYLQLYKQIREDIIAGNYPYNTKLPSKRNLALETGVSTITVEHAYALLCEEGYVESRERSGFVVIFQKSDGFAAASEPYTTNHLHDHQPAYPDFPVSVLSKTMRKVLTERREVLLDKAPNQGCFELREAIRHYLFRSPTCTPADQAAAEYLAEIAGIDVESYANEMFLAASDLCHKSEEEIFFQDFKKFSSENVTFGISQIMSMNAEELKMIGDRIKPSLTRFRENQQVDMVFFMLTDIVKESTTLLYAGEDVESLLEVSYGHSGADNSIKLAGVVSRKKQLVPALIRGVEQM